MFFFKKVSSAGNDEIRHISARRRIQYRMTLNELKKGERAVVLTVEAPVLVRERLRALGIFTGEKLYVLKVSRRKSVFVLQAVRSGTKTAIDRETAAGIKVWKA